MRWVSSTKSAEDGVVSVLAIVETALAIAIAIGTAAYFETLSHVLFASAIAPLLLLRTRRSTVVGLKWFAAIQRLWKLLFTIVYTVPFWLTRNVGRWPLAQLVLAVVAMFFILPCMAVVLAAIHIVITVCVSIACRAVALAYCLLTHPLETVGAIPANWYRYAACTDIFTLPEVMPGNETSGIAAGSSTLRSFRISRSWELLTQERARFNWFHEATIWIVAVLLLTMYVPSVFLRFSIKSSSIVWVPLVWLVRWRVGIATRRSLAKERPRVAIRKLRETKGSYVQVVLAAITLVLFSASLFGEIVALSAYQLTSRLSPSVEAMVVMFVPRDFSVVNICVWHVARVVNASLDAWLVLWFADHAKIGLEEGTATEGAVRRTLQRTRALQVVLSLYVVGCFVLQLYYFAMYVSLPDIQWRLVPVPPDSPIGE